MQSDTKFWCLNALFDLSIKFPDLFQETINLVIYRHFLGSSRSGHPVTSSYGVKLPRVHENLLGHLSRVYRVASVGSWSTVSRWVRSGIALLSLLPAQQSGKSRSDLIFFIFSPPKVLFWLNFSPHESAKIVAKFLQNFSKISPKFPKIS